MSGEGRRQAVLTVCAMLLRLKYLHFQNEDRVVSGHIW
jgi:hypothetical protein